LIEKLWEDYKLADDSRRRAFYYLFSSMAFFALVWINRKGKIKLPFFEAEVDPFIVLTIAPMLIFILTERYLFLCVHSILNRVYFFKHYQENYKDEFEQIGYTVANFFRAIKIRDMTGQLNIFLFPSKYSKELDVPMNINIGKIFKFFLNILILISIALPIILYIMIVIWLSLNYSNNLSEFIGLSVIMFYSLTGIALLFSLIYFYYRVKDSRKFIREQLWAKTDTGS
jgi:hypothetical protein